MQGHQPVALFPEGTTSDGSVRGWTGLTALAAAKPYTVTLSRTAGTPGGGRLGTYFMTTSRKNPGPPTSLR